jgi:hypothetical protein
MERFRVFAALVTSLVVSLLIACAAGGKPTANIQSAPAAANPTARTIIRNAIDAMGGEARLRAIHSVHMAIMASGALVEGADRPEAPWQINHYTLDDWLDYEHGAWRKDVQSMVLDGGNGRWSKFSVIAAGGVAAVLFDGKARAGSPVHLGDAAEHLLYQPDRLALIAIDAPDVRRDGDASIAGQPHQIVAFHHAGMSIRLWIDARTHRLNAAEILHQLPDDAYWRVYGDVHDRLGFLRWTLDPSGVWFARQYDLIREGVPYHSFLVTALEVNAVAPDTFTITDETRAAYRVALARSRVPRSDRSRRSPRASGSRRRPGTRF